MLFFSLCLCASSLMAAQTATDWPTGNRTTPPTINSVSPLGIPRGAPVELTVEGLNLAGTSAVYFSEPGIKARVVRIKELPDLPDIRLGSNGTPSTVDLGPLPPRNQVTLEIEAGPDASIGAVRFRLQTPLGTSPEGRFVVEPYYGESPDREPNDTAEDAFPAILPTVLVGAISKPGDLDWYKLQVKAGEEVVFENNAPGSALEPVIGIYDADRKLLREISGIDAARFAHKFDKGGAYYVRISDFQQSGSAGHFYRIMAGHFPVAISAWPLGLQKGKSADISLEGWNLTKRTLRVEGRPSRDDEHAAVVRPDAFTYVKLPLGNEPEITASGAEQSITIPVTVNGRLTAAQNDFRFHARKGEKLVFEVTASRLGSPLDSLLEVLDQQRSPVERATIRCVLETSVTLRDHDSSGSGIRLTSPDGLAVNDYLMLGGEIIRIDAVPRTPDDDFRAVSFGGQRIGYLDTTPEAHALDQPVYKVQIHPAGTKFASNGLPLVHLPYRNDDGGPGFGKDSLLHFTAPADGDYIVRLRDVRGQRGERFTYRLSARRPEPGFRLSVNPRNPNVPAGGRIPVTVTALRLDDFDGPIEVALEHLPAGFTATHGTIAPGQVSTTLLLSAAPDAKLDRAVPLEIAGRTTDPLELMALVPRPDVQMTAATRTVDIVPGGRAEIEVSIRRNNGYGGRVPVEVRNLPPGVRVLDVGLNGVLINENETRRSFTLEALPTAVPIEQPIVLAGTVETRADNQQTSYAAEPVLLRVKPGANALRSAVR